MLEGRLQHVRCTIGNTTLDLINCYQHPNNPAKNRPEPLKSRSQFWNAWEDLLSKLPFRNLLLTAGDFNCTMDKQRATAGRELPFPDQDHFQAIIKRFSLASVRVHDPSPSYLGPAGHSNIDYIFARRPQLDQLSRQARCIQTFPLNSHREYPDHLPIACSIPLQWKAWYCQSKSAQPRLSRPATQRMRQEWEAHSSDWNAFETKVHQELHLACNYLQTPSQVTSCVIQTCDAYFRTPTVKREACPQRGLSLL